MQNYRTGEQLELDFGQNYDLLEITEEGYQFQSIEIKSPLFLREHEEKESDTRFKPIFPRIPDVPIGPWPEKKRGVIFPEMNDSPITPDKDKRYGCAA